MNDAMNDVENPRNDDEGRGVYKQEVFDAFVLFMSMPDPDKAKMFDVPFDEKKGRYEWIPKQVDFAKKYGVSQETLSGWKRRKDFVSAVDAKHRQWGLDTVPNVMAALYRRCLKYGISTDIELFLAYYQNWDRKQVIRHEHEKFDMNDVRALIAPLPKEKQEKFYALIDEIIGEARVSGTGSAV